MKIASLSIKNFHSIVNEKIELEKLTMFVGPNGCGKSNFLKALNFFYEPKIKATKEDFFNRDLTQPIEIEVAYDQLSTSEITQFEKYLTAERRLIVIKRFNGIDSFGKYFGKLKKSPELSALPRKPADDLKEKYKELRGTTKFSDLPDAKTGPAIEEAILAWEENHPEHLALMESETQFFGFENNSAASLEKFTKFVYIPAVMMESHLADDKAGPIGELTDILARHQLKEDAEIKRLEEEIRQRFSERLRPLNAGQMTTLSQGITDKMHAYYRDVGITIQLDENVSNINLPTPKAIVSVNEGGYQNPVNSAGQGLQRAFVLSLLQFFAEHRPNNVERTEDLNLILGIDEPELYQHPSKQKLFYKVLKELTTTGTTVAGNVQCFYTTHSSLMLNIEEFNNVVRVAKEPCHIGELCATKIYKSDLDEIAKREAYLPSRGQQFTALKTLSGLINTIDARINEGFFSSTVVLVEGASDIVALRTASETHPDGAINLDQLDIAIIECGGKTNLEKPQIVFSALGIKTYCIWDSDYGLHEKWVEVNTAENAAEGAEKEELKKRAANRKTAADSEFLKNRDLLALHKEELCDWPDHVGLASAAHKYDLETTLCLELGEDYLTQLVEKHNNIVKAKNAWKNPLVMSLVLNEAFTSGKRSPTLDKILVNIVTLNQNKDPEEDEAIAQAA
ncbi:MAG: ATP-dependent endonuclease [Alphaproteobacteria bacterium]|nr:ATP-dependent endonuclease [Alphaproteobacteria bacterium]